MCIRDRISGLKPSVILAPGDIIDTPAKQIRSVADGFRKLSAPYGVYATTGNHEYYVGTVSYTHLRAHETVLDLVCRLLLEKKK